MIIALFVAFWAIFSFTLPQQFTYDGLCYALDVERGPLTNLFHPGHLLYSAFMRVFWKGAGLLGYHGPAIYLMQALNALVAAGAVALLAALLVRKVHKPVALAGASLFGFSYAFWFEAADPGCYAFAGLAGVALLWLLVEGPSSRPFLLGLVHGFLVLWHQMLILVAPAFLLKVRHPGVGRGPVDWAGMTKYVLGLSLGAVVPYAIVAAAFHGGSLNEAFYWALGPAGPPPGTPILSSYWWSVDFFKNVTAFADALAQAFVMIPGQSPWAGYAVAVIIIVLALRQWRQTPVWLWIAALGLFQFFFSPGILRFRILLLVPLIYLALINSKRVFPFILIVAGMALTNGISAKAKMTPPADRERVAWVRQVVGPNDFFVYRGGEGSITNVYLVYFAPQVPAQSLQGYQFANPSGDWTALEATLAQVKKRGGRVFIERSIIDSDRPWVSRWNEGKTLDGPNGYKLLQLK